MPDSTAKHPSPPYATFTQFIGFLNKLRDKPIPSRIDASIFGNASGSLSYSVIAALKSLKLIQPNGIPNSEFAALVEAGDEERKAILKEAMKNAYPTLHSSQFPLENATAGQFDEHLRNNYEAKGSTIDKVASFFIQAAVFAGIPISEHILNRKPSAGLSTNGKSRRQRKQPEVPPLEKPASSISEKALEYRLVDLMSEAIDEPSVIQSILNVVTFLKRRDATKTATDQ